MLNCFNHIRSCQTENVAHFPRVNQNERNDLAVIHVNCLTNGRKIFSPTAISHKGQPRCFRCHVYGTSLLVFRLCLQHDDCGECQIFQKAIKNDYFN